MRVVFACGMGIGAVCAGACTGVPRPQEPAPLVVAPAPRTGGRSVPLPTPEDLADRFVVQGAWVPVANFELDTDEGTLVGQPFAVESGDGFELFGGLAGPSSRAGLLFASIDFEGGGSPSGLATVGFELARRIPFDEGGTVAAEVGTGFGIADLDVGVPGIDDLHRGYWQGRLGFRVEAGSAVSFVVAGTATVIGEPGDTVATGGYLLLGASLRF